MVVSKVAVVSFFLHGILCNASNSVGSRRRDREASSFSHFRGRRAPYNTYLHGEEQTHGNRELEDGGSESLNDVEGYQFETDFADVLRHGMSMGMKSGSGKSMGMESSDSMDNGKGKGGMGGKESDKESFY